MKGDSSAQSRRGRQCFGFQQPFTVELSGEAWTESSDAPLAYVTSVGFDGKPRTNDDLAWRIELDGTVTPVNANE